MTTGIEIREVDKVKGRGVFAIIDLDPDMTVMSAACDIAVLYSSYVQAHCVVCFANVAKRKASDDTFSCVTCSSCGQYVMCEACTHSNRGLEFLKHHPQVCAWFMTLPADVRAGDTDYLRFLLEYCARVQDGDMRVALAVSDCCTLADSQSAETKAFCESYSRLVAGTFRSQGLGIDQEHLRDTLLRTKANALGFPFSEEATLGWAMQGDFCMLNHSCLPNCALKQSAQGEMELASLVTIAAGEELTISYLHLEEYLSVGERTKHLLEQYRFLCKCELCVAQREGRLPASLPKGTTTGYLHSIRQTFAPVTAPAATTGQQPQVTQGGEHEQPMKSVD
jgi:hypothetical protein